MYRKIFTPTEHNNTVPFTVPPEWYGKKLEFIVFPVEFVSKKDEINGKADIMKYFGTWKTDESAKEIIANIRSSPSDIC